MKIDTHQTKFESIQKTQDEGWIDSNFFWLDSNKSESFHDTIQTVLNLFIGYNSRQIWLDSNT